MILPHHGVWPKIHETAFVAPSADIVGEVEMGAESSAWFQSVIRGDINSIKIGARTNIQDHTCIHVTRKTAPVEIGDDVTVGHRALLHGCTIKNRVLIGMGAIVMDRATIQEDSVVGAGALVTEGKTFPPRSLIMGSPAKAVRLLTDEEVGYLLKSSAHYVHDGQEYRGFVGGPTRHGRSNDDLEDFDEDLDEAE